jgi:hypothetical protein
VQSTTKRVLASADANYLTLFQGPERTEHIRHENQEILEVCAAGANHQQRNRTTAQGLLIRHVLVHRDQNVKTCLICCGQQCAVRQTSEACIAAGLTLVTREVMAKSLVYALVQEKAHLVAGE